MKKIILVYGDLAAGKTTLAKQLAAKFSLPAYHKDDFKEALAGAFPCANREDNKLLSHKAVEAMLLTFQNTAPSGADILLESNFHTDDLAQIARLAQQFGYDILSVVLTGDVDLLYKRYVQRELSGARHPMHMANGFTDEAAFKQYVVQTRIAQSDRPGEVLDICADTFNLADTGVLSVVQKFLQKNPTT